MTDREKTITCLKAYVNCYADWHKKCNQNCVLYGLGDCAKYVIESINDALELLKEQEAQTVLSNRICESYPSRYIRKGFCPKCHQEVEWLFNRNYCGFCGQAVKWNDKKRSEKGS